MYRIYNTITKSTTEYRYLTDLLDDVITDNDTIEWIDEIYGYTNIPIIGETSTGEIIRENDPTAFRCIQIDDYIPSIAETVRENIEFYGEYEYDFYVITETE